MIFKDKEEKAGDKQIGGSHYTNLTITPWGFEVLAFPAQFKGYLLGTTIHYLSRVNVKDIEGKGGLQDIKKAHHVLSYLIEHLEK